MLNSRKSSANSFSAWRVLTPGSFRSKDLQTETTGLRERIRHLNDMVFCQQRKVKAMIEEVKTAHLFLPWCTCTMKLGVGRGPVRTSAIENMAQSQQRKEESRA